MLLVEGGDAEPFEKDTGIRAQEQAEETDELESASGPSQSFPTPGEKGSQVSTGSLSDWLDKKTLAHEIKSADREPHYEYGMGEVRALCQRGGQGRLDYHLWGPSPHRSP